MPKSKEKRGKQNFAGVSKGCRNELEDRYIVIPFTFKIGSSNPSDQVVTGYVLI